MAIESDPGPPAPGLSRKVGLCVRCRFAGIAHNERGGEFWRCSRPEGAPEFPRYPSLPVVQCRGFEESP